MCGPVGDGTPETGGHRLDRGADPCRGVGSPCHREVSSMSLVYVANLRGNSVSAIDPTTDTVVATIPVGRFPEGVAVSPDGAHAYVTNDADSTVSVIDTAANTVTALIPVGRFPNPVAFSPDGAHAYVGRFVSPGIGGVDVIDTSTNTVTATVQVGNQPFGIAVTPDGTHVYVACFVGSSVSVIDTATNTVTATISSPSARTPAGIAITPDGSHAYTANFNSNNVSVIDTATNTITTLIPVGSGPEGIAISPDGTHVYVADANANSVAVIDTATNTVTATIAVGASPVAVLVDPAGTTAYVSNAGANTVSVIDTATNTVTATVAVGNTPFGLAEATAPPTVTALNPTHGPEAGGGTITIAGTHLAGTQAVTFGTTPATDVTVANDFTVTATIPAHTDGTVDVTVTTPAGTSATSPADLYTYDEPAPTVTALNPTHGFASGGTGVTITGTDLLGATAVTFGTTPATSFAVNDDTSITATAPAGTGTVDVTVTTPAGTSATSPADLYTYDPDTTNLTAHPIVASVTPPGPPDIFLDLSATLTDTITGQPAPGQTINFTVGTHTVCTAVTDSTGTATCHSRVAFVEAVRHRQYTATFAGTPALAPATDTAPLILIHT
ncbi:IPT/TIG domain-containing protein [Streptomyces noursei]